jgi:hypothetical protein
MMTRRTLPAAAMILGAFFLFMIPTDTEAIDRSSFSMEILVDGRPLQEYAARGTTYIEALEGSEYAIRLRNRTGRRIAVALSVDGLNSIDAKSTTMQDASKWVIGPYRTITIEGWQTAQSTARSFFFTTEDRSYGAWLGKTDNLGVITAAVFREKRPRRITRYHEESRRMKSSAGRGERYDAPEAIREPAAECEKKEGLSDDLAATGIGREIDHSVRKIRLNLESSPAAVMELRYEYRDALVRLGVLPRVEDPIARREGARGFEDMEFAPDPFRVDR